MTGMPNYPRDLGPEATGDEPLRLAAPADVQTSVRLWFASILVALVGAILGYLLTDQAAAVQEVLDADTTGLSRETVQTAVTIGLVAGIVLVLLLLGLQAFFVLKLKAGRNWARIVLTVLAALSVLATVTSFGRGVGIGTVVNVVSVLLVVGAVVFMFRPAANAYLSPRRA